MERILRRARVLLGLSTERPRGDAPAPTPAEGAGQSFNAPSVAMLVMGSLFWGAMMTVTTLFALCLDEGLASEHAGALGLLYFLGGALAWSPALLTARRLSRGRPVETRFAVWAFQFVFTGASAVYQFAVLGDRLSLPLGLPFLLVASVCLARRNGQAAR